MVDTLVTSAGLCGCLSQCPALCIRRDTEQCRLGHTFGPSMPGDGSQVCCQQDTHHWANSDSWICTDQGTRLIVTQAPGHGLADKTPATQTWGPSSIHSTHIRKQVWWGALVTPALGRQRQQGPWRLLGVNSCLIGEHQANDTCLKAGDNVPEIASGLTQTCICTQIYTCAHTHAHMWRTMAQEAESNGP